MSTSIRIPHNSKQKESGGNPGSAKGQKPLKLVRSSVRPKRPKSIVNQPERTTNPTPETPTETSVPGCYRRLFDAIYGNDLDTVKHLITHEKIDVNVVDEDDPLRPTPLLVVCEHQLMDIARELFKAKPKPDVNMGNRKGRRPIWWAAKHGNKELTELIVYEGKEQFDANVLDEESGCTPLYRAILSNAPEVCRLLVQAGADVNLRRLWKNTGESEVAESPLVKAVQLGNYEICDLLINSMCKIQARTEIGFTALHYAVGYRRYKIVDLLLEDKIHVNARSRQGVTAMTVAIREHLPLMCRKLIEWGYDVDRKFKWNETPLEMAIRLHAESCAMVLVQWGCQLAKGGIFRIFRLPKEPPSIFRKAADEGLLKLMRLLTVVYPYFFYESWIREGDVPVALYTKPGIRQWLRDESCRVRPLQDLCRSSVLMHLGRYSCIKLEKLPLPEKMKEYLRLSDHISDKMLREKSLYEHECPYFCPSACPRRPQCPELDFSDSASDND